MNNITNFIKRFLGIKPKKSVTVTINKSTVDKIEKYHGVDIENEFENVLKGEFKSDDLNQITLKMNVIDDRGVIIEDKPKKKSITRKNRKHDQPKLTSLQYQKKL